MDNDVETSGTIQAEDTVIESHTVQRHCSIQYTEKKVSVVRASLIMYRRSVVL